MVALNPLYALFHVLPHCSLFLLFFTHRTTEDISCYKKNRLQNHAQLIASLYNMWPVETWFFCNSEIIFFCKKSVLKSLWGYTRFWQLRVMAILKREYNIGKVFYRWMGSVVHDWQSWVVWLYNVHSSAYSMTDRLMWSASHSNGRNKLHCECRTGKRATVSFRSQNHRVAWDRRDIRDYLVSTFCRWQCTSHQIRLPKVPSSLALKRLCRQQVPVHHHSLSKVFLPNI